MDTKKRTKNIKLKLKELGYDVKHTHCKEVLAVAHGFRNSHHLSGKNTLSEAMDVLLEKNIYITIGLKANTTNEYYTEKIKGCKVHFSQIQINELIEARDFIRDKNISVNLNCGKISPFESFDNDFFIKKTKANKCLQQEKENYPLNNIDVVDNLNEGNKYFSKDFYLEKNCFNYEEAYESYIKANKNGIFIEVTISDKYQETTFSSYSISWSELDLNNKNKLN